MKKLYLTIIALIICFSCFAVHAETGPAIVSSDVYVMPGDIIIVPVAIENNSGIISFKCSVDYNKDEFEFVKCDDTELLSGFQSTYFVEGAYLLRYQTALNQENNMSNGVVANLTFKVKNGFSGKSYIAITYKEANRLDDDKYTVSNVKFESGNITVKSNVVLLENNKASFKGITGKCLGVIASYKGAVLVDFKFFDIENDAEFNISEQINTEGSTEIKAFLWDIVTNMKPLCEAEKESVK